MLRVLVSLENKINARHLDVDTQLPDGPVLVWGDPDAITQVCYNLLDNAIKFSAEGSTMGLSITAKGGKAHVAVRNHGDTIPPDELAMIFDRFHRAATNPAPRPGGRGPGAGISSRLSGQQPHGEHFRHQPGRRRMTGSYLP
ncbi:MAG: ATP-binding protein [Flavonifractor plautii]